MFVTGIAAGAVIFMILVAAVIVLLPFLIGSLNRKRRSAGWFFLAVLLISLLIAKEYYRNGWPWPALSGTIDFEIGEPLSKTVERSTYPFPGSVGRDSIFATNDVVDLRFRFRGAVLSFPTTGGMSSAALILSSDSVRRTLRSVSFVDQHRPLTLDEALERAEATEAKLGALGFQRAEPSFDITERADRRPAQRELDWQTARRLLAEDEAVLAMRLYSLKANGVTYSAELRNMARNESSTYDHNFGREWLLSIWIGEAWELEALDAIQDEPKLALDP